jgi:hypothetical protein
MKFELFLAGKNNCLAHERFYDVYLDTIPVHTLEYFLCSKSLGQGDTL